MGHQGIGIDLSSSPTFPAEIGHRGPGFILLEPIKCASLATVISRVIGAIAPNLGALAPNLGAIAPNLGAIAPNLCAIAPKFGAIAPNFGAIAPNFGTIAPSSLLYHL